VYFHGREQFGGIRRVRILDWDNWAEAQVWRPSSRRIKFEFVPRGEGSLIVLVCYACRFILRAASWMSWQGT
jgi:hypothetical protein